MKSKFARIGAIMVIVAAALGASAAPVAATGNCNDAYVILYRDVNYGGPSVKMCVGVNDPDFEKDPAANPAGYFGPTSTGAQVADWHSSDAASGVTSFKLWYKPGYSIRFCMYYGKNYSTQMFNETANRNNPQLNVLENDAAGSLKWTTNLTC